MPSALKAIVVLVMGGALSLAHVPAGWAAKGDLKAAVPRSAPLLSGRTLDLRLADFAQGIWVSDASHCPVDRIDRSPPGSVLAIHRSLYEKPGRICQVYGAEARDKRSQRAAMNCVLSDGGEALELVTVRPRGTKGLVVQEGERPPVLFRFCAKIEPLLRSLTSN